MSSQPTPSKTKTYSRRASLGIIAAAIPSAAWGFLGEPDTLSITQKNLTLKDWPPALAGFRIAHLTDLHFRPGVDDALLTKLTAAVQASGPDLILITGDFLIRDPSSLPELCRHLKKLSATHGIIASPGNHDRWHCSSGFLKKHLEAAGISYLQNHATTLTIKGEQLYLPGLDSIWGGNIDPSRAWKAHRKGDPVIALVHEPDVFDHLHPTRPLTLQLSGHTHGGQCRVPLIGYAPAKVKYGRNYLYGHYQKNDAQLWVGRGIGTVGLRVRFACPPELSILTLR
ncbi:MAG: metallophosphoesterase [Verrucomicrobiaceae bacterium]